MSGKTNTLDIPITKQELDDWIMSGVAVHKYFPHLTASQREFLISGMTDEEWDNTFESDS